MMGKSKAQKKLIENLGDEFVKVMNSLLCNSLHNMNLLYQTADQSIQNHELTRAHGAVYDADPRVHWSMIVSDRSRAKHNLFWAKVFTK